MRWLKPNLKSSIYALLGHAGPSGEQLDVVLDEIREAMLALLGPEGQAARPVLTRRLRHATEIQTLWYARSELMAALAAMHGEAQARGALKHLTARFDGLMPSAFFNQSARSPW